MASCCQTDTTSQLGVLVRQPFCCKAFTYLLHLVIPKALARSLHWLPFTRRETEAMRKMFPAAHERMAVKPGTPVRSPLRAAHTHSVHQAVSRSSAPS